MFYFFLYTYLFVVCIVVSNGFIYSCCQVYQSGQRDNHDDENGRNIYKDFVTVNKINWPLLLFAASFILCFHFVFFSLRFFFNKITLLFAKAVNWMLKSHSCSASGQSRVLDCYLPRHITYADPNSSGICF